MSLVPYHPQEGREIVLRHRNAIVVHDPSSQRLEIRGLAECPTCHRPLRSASPERSPYGDEGHHGGDHGGGHHGGPGRHHEGFVDPNYFRLLRAGHLVGQLRAGPSSSPAPGRPPAAAPRTAGPLSSPLRRLFQPLGVGGGGDDDEVYGETGGGEGGGGAADAADAADTRDATSSFPVPRDAEFVSSAPYVAPDAAASPINKEAFSPNYFRTFFVEERELGRGGKGVVLLVRHEIDGCQLGHFACKRVPVGDDHAWLEKVLVEVELLAKLSHPNLVSYRHVWLENVTLNRFGPRVACAFILQQYCNGGDLHRYVIGDQPKEATKEELKARMRRRSKGQAEQRPEDLFPAYRHLAFDEIYSLFKDITSGLAYLHAATYIHRDLKPSNCLLHHEGGGPGGRGNLNGSGLASSSSGGLLPTCLISDFGEVQPANVARKSTGTTGTISYCAPEVLRQDAASGLYGNFTTKSDVFSLGMILYFMCFGRLPYRSANAVHEELEDVDELRAEIADWKGFQYERRERPDLPSKLYQLLTRMLSVNPAERPSAADVLLAMRTDNSSNGLLDGMMSRGGSGSSSTMAPPIGISGRRIQNLDSPAPSTPVPDPSKPRHSGSPASSHVEDLDESAIDDSDDLYDPSSPRFRPHSGSSSISINNSSSNNNNSLQQQKRRHATSLTLSRSSRASHSHSRSPERRSHAMSRRGGSSGGGLDMARRGSTSPTTATTATTPPPLLSPVRRQHQQDDDNEEPTSSTPLVANSRSTPAPTGLLMPPPSTFWGEVRHRGLVARYHAALALRRHAQSAAFLFRTALFLAKMASLARPCWPFMVRWGVGAPLVLAAGLDLGVPSGSSGSGGDGQRQRPPPPRWRWDWRASVVLLALHFVVLGLATRAEVLCTSRGPETWEAAWQ